MSTAPSGTAARSARLRAWTATPQTQPRSALLANHGVARISELYAIGLSKDQVAERVRRGAFVRHGYGVIGLAGIADSLLSRAMRATLVSGAGSAASLWTAAELHRLDAPPDDLVHVVREGPSRRSDHPGIVLPAPADFRPITS